MSRFKPAASSHFSHVFNLSEFNSSGVWRWIACLCLSLLLALSGCATKQMVSETYLEQAPIASMRASLPKGSSIAPGESSPLSVAILQPDGTVLTTEGYGEVKVLWKDLSVTSTLVAVNKKGIVSLSSDPRVSDGKVAHVTVTLPSHPGIQAELDVPVRYDRSYTAAFYGSNGSSGFGGVDGISGISGSMGSLDPEHPSAGGDGSNGTNGSDGQDGGNGEDGPSVQVRVAFRQADHPLLQVGVSAGGQEKLFLVDPQGGSLTVSSVGGSGGSGGKGGRGGRAGSGGVGIPNGRDGSSGSDGRDGSDGRSGSAGSIAVTYDPQAKPFLSAIRFSTPGGPAPVFKEVPVSPLW